MGGRGWEGGGGCRLRGSKVSHYGSYSVHLLEKGVLFKHNFLSLSHCWDQ